MDKRRKQILPPLMQKPRSDYTVGRFQLAEQQNQTFSCSSLTVKVTLTEKVQKIQQFQFFLGMKFIRNQLFFGWFFWKIMLK